ncbi:4-(cytidine 5'-diphospho)-2-C-methyl-D-erythritol kinase [uncultured Muribaculum sp.]|uniref:4-(cytidine 5'-diphospho)-2-C-methyl-D-erythritol kinase n=1 Tax=uncultured Muribaculum sp. TaxID=1918613 RepID=UPI0025DEEF3D|nr:4-(cytidine 5'-diphospho)-2-C-methyl-D-erythritol kinase [uncultured Muribaculum sp.]
MILFPNAKINLGLYITGRRPDGYHDLLTAFYPVNWHDILEIVPARGEDTTLTVTGRGVDCPPEKNLVMRAYRALAEVAPLSSVDIYLHKVIPDGAGLGGGSADAAFTILGLNNLFSLGLAADEMARVAARIGADCPFFIYDRPMLATGIGDVFSPCEVSLAGVPVLIVKPDVHVSTREAYVGVTPRDPDVDLAGLLAGPVASWQGRLVNQFEQSVFQAHPEIAGLKSAILGMGAAYASMSGSGSAVFGIFPGADSDKLSREASIRFAGMEFFVSTNRM